MEDKRFRETFHQSSEQQLTFTKEDRNEVFEQIRKIEYNYPTEKKLHISSKKYVPVTVSLLIVGLCLFLFLPSLLTENVNDETIHSHLIEHPNIDVVSAPAVEDVGFETTLITVKSKEAENLIYLNLLVSTSRDQKKVNLISIPKDTYAPVSKNEDGSMMYDKLLFAYRFGGAENVKATVSKLLDLPIDHYAVIELETISALIESINGIEYDLQEDILIRAITQVAFEFEKGTHRFTGEEVVALLMSTSELDKLDESHLLKLLDSVLKKVEHEMSPNQLKQWLAQVEANFPVEQLSAHEINSFAKHHVSLIDGMTYTMIDERFYIQYEKDYLNAVSEKLTSFN